MIKRHIKSGLKVLKARFFKKRYPIKVNFICTYSCDMACYYCKIGQLKKKTELNTQQVEEMIDSLANLGAEQITFIGGEPLIRGDIGELITYAKEKELFTTMSSNCNLLKKKLKELKDLDLLITCLNGPEQVHDFIRGKGNYKKVIEVLSSESIKTGKIVTAILTKHNVDYVDFLLKKAQELGFYINFQPAFRNELAKVEDGSIDDILLSREDINKAFCYLIKKKKEGFPIMNSYGLLTSFARYGKAIFNKCYLGRLSLTIDPGGNVYRCYKEVNSKVKINAPSVGWKEAIYRIKLNNCTECSYGCHIEDNLLFNLNPSSIFNLLRLNNIFKNGK